MPSSLHQILVDLLRHAPQLVPELLQAAGAVGTAGTVEAVRPLDAVLDQLERRVDLALEVRLAGLGPVAIGLEVQLAIVPAKLCSWPVYVTTLRSLVCPRALLVVLTPDPGVARWAAQPIDLGPGNEAFCVHVIGPEQIPRIRRVHEARRAPELAVLSALAHANADGDGELVRVALVGLEALDRGRAWSYGCVLMRALDVALQATLKDTMLDIEAAAEEKSEVTDEFVERAFRWARRTYEEELRREAAEERARERGLAQGLEEGLERGLERGLEEGRMQGHREVLLRLLARAGLRPSPDEVGRIEGCAELARLDRWIDQAVTATTVAGALAER
ncbi:MAG: hypothetical protein JNK56_34230 [Myxococcales bacterium]|nr:hypothetical protein [Myxococcales bacterium]